MTQHRKSLKTDALVAANQAAILEAGLEADVADKQLDQCEHRQRGPPAGKSVMQARQATGVTPRLYGRREVVALCSLSYPTIWGLACRGAFPRGRVVGGKTLWLAREIDAWIAALPQQRLKCDGAPAAPRRTRKSKTEAA